MTELTPRELIDVIVRSLRETARRFGPKHKRAGQKRQATAKVSVRAGGKKRKLPARPRRRRRK
jgi:hypothetical protein